MSHDDTDIGKIDTTDEMQQMASPITLYDIKPFGMTYMNAVGEIIRREGPCAIFGHRPAHRVDGGIECFDCGAQFT